MEKKKKKFKKKKVGGCVENVSSGGDGVGSLPRSSRRFS
jgi:hypothetical protein